MAYGDRITQFLQDSRFKNLGHQARPRIAFEGPVVVATDTCRLLAPVLLSVQSQVGQVYGLGVPVDTEQTTVMLG